jgi:isopenicillin N synthase-like dioxygenase
VEETFQQSQQFFNTAPEVKRSVSFRMLLYFGLSSYVQVDISKSTNFRGYMGLLTENNNPFVPSSAYLSDKQ